MFLLVIISQVLSFVYITGSKYAESCLSINHPNGNKNVITSYFNKKKNWEDGYWIIDNNKLTNHFCITVLGSQLWLKYLDLFPL